VRKNDALILPILRASNESRKKCQEYFYLTFFSALSRLGVMEFKVHKAVLDTLLSRVYPIIPSRSTVATLSSILVEAREGKVYLSATDLDTSATAIGEAEVSQEGAIALNGKDLFGIAKELPSETLGFKVENLIATIECKKGKFTMAGIEKSEFPALSTIENGRNITIPYAALQRAIDKSLFAAATGESDRDLAGVLLDLQQNEFRLAATDRCRLVIFKQKMEVDKIAQLLVSSKVWREVCKFESGVEVAFEENKIAFSTEDMIIVSRLMEKEFPPYESVIPKDNEAVLTVSKEELTKALRRVLIFAPEISRFTKFILKSDSLLVEATSEVGEAKEEIPCKYKGPDLEIAYNGSYLLTMLGKIDTDEVKFLLKDQESGALVVPAEQKQDEEITYLLMPIRLD
jgi:DNA polymerase-3 subunit beta